MFSLRRSAWSVLKCNQGSDVLAEFSGTFCQDNYVFEREFMYFEMFHRRFIIFSLRRLREKLAFAIWMIPTRPLSSDYNFYSSLV